MTAKEMQLVQQANTLQKTSNYDVEDLVARALRERHPDAWLQSACMDVAGDLSEAEDLHHACMTYVLACGGW